MQTQGPQSQPKTLLRTFRDLQDERIADIETLTALARMGSPGGLDWSDLLESSRIMMISEAGAGKTFECRGRQEALWAAGEPAFFLELAELARSPLKDMLSATEERRFDAWLAAENEVATFLLDSIDELKLTQGSFEQALKRLAKALEGRLDRARIVITTRPVPFDQELVRRHLPAPDRRPAGGLAESFADVAMRNSTKKAGEEPARWISVALMPLSDDQIRTMATLEGIADPDDMIADLRTRDAMDFARRPQDLVELCADWRDHHRIRTHREQVGNNVDVKLQPRRDRDRPELAELSPSRVRDGAARLALAMLLTRRLTIRYAAEADRGGAPGTSLDPGAILTEWTLPEVTTLLERPLFGFASYGRVRFHHRSVLEFLAAERLDAMIASGVPIRAIKRVLLAETAQGSGSDLRLHRGDRRANGNASVEGGAPSEASRAFPTPSGLLASIGGGACVGRNRPQVLKREPTTKGKEMKVTANMDSPQGFCLMINDIMGYDRAVWAEALAGVRIPVGYKSVALFDAVCGSPSGGVSSKVANRRPSALDVAIVMYLGRSSSARLKYAENASDGVLELFVDVDYEALAKKSLRA